MGSGCHNYMTENLAVIAEYNDTALLRAENLTESKYNELFINEASTPIQAYAVIASAVAAFVIGAAAMWLVTIKSRNKVSAMSQPELLGEQPRCPDVVQNRISLLIYTCV